MVISKGVHRRAGHSPLRWARPDERRRTAQDECGRGPSMAAGGDGSGGQRWRRQGMGALEVSADTEGSRGCRQRWQMWYYPQAVQIHAALPHSVDVPRFATTLFPDGTALTQPFVTTIIILLFGD